jgi:hypothetical protein
MKTTDILKTKAHKCRRKIVVAEINILRNFESRELVDGKIVRELSKLHSLWFKDRAWKTCSA